MEQVGELERRKITRQKTLEEGILHLGRQLRALVRRKRSCSCGVTILEDFKRLEHTHKRLKEEEVRLRRKKQDTVDIIMKGPKNRRRKAEGAPTKKTEKKEKEN